MSRSSRTMYRPPNKHRSPSKYRPPSSKNFSSEFQAWPAKKHVKTYVEWTIHYFWSLSREISFYIDSDRFTLSGTEWYISLCPNSELDDKEWISLYLCKGESCKEHYVDYNIGIKNYDGTVLKALKAVDKFEIKTPEVGYSRFIQRFTLKRSNAVSRGGSLTVFCSVEIVEEPFALSSKKVASHSLSPHKTMEPASQTLHSDDFIPGIQSLIENFKDLYLSKRFADVTIIVEGREYFAHKNVLASRSTVFSSMFTSDIAEKNSGKVEITDCDRDTFEDFLLFLYTGKLNMVTPSNAPSLYNTAKSFDVQELKAECVRYMINELTIDFFCDVVCIALMHDETEILQAATHFFIENAKNILVTKKWMNFLVRNPSVGNELVIKFVNKYT